MRVTQIHVEGFRSIRDATVERLPEISLVVGANNAGKSNLLAALRYFRIPWAGGHRFDPADFCAYSDFPECRVTLSVHLEQGELQQVFNDAAPRVSADPRYLRSILDPVEARLRDWRLTTVFRPQGQPAQIGLHHEATLLGGASLPAMLGAAKLSVPGADGTSVESSVMGLQTWIGWSVGAWVANRIHGLGPTRKPAPSVGAQAQDSVSEDASNLANALYRHWGMNNPQFQMLQEWVHDMFPTVEGVVLVPGLSQELSLGIKESGIPAIIRVDAMSSGITQAVAILAHLALAPNGALVTVEEPEAHFSPGSIKLLVERIALESRRVQVILATHSEDVLSVQSIGPDVWYASRGPAGDTTIQRLNKIDYIDWLSVSLHGSNPNAPGAVQPRPPPGGH